MALSPSACVKIYSLFFYRGLKDLELDTPSIEKRFAYSFLQQLIRYVDEAHQYILEFGIVPLAHFLNNY